MCIEICDKQTNTSLLLLTIVSEKVPIKEHDITNLVIGGPSVEEATVLHHQPSFSPMSSDVGEKILHLRTTGGDSKATGSLLHLELFALEAELLDERIGADLEKCQHCRMLLEDW